MTAREKRLEQALREILDVFPIDNRLGRGRRRIEQANKIVGIAIWALRELNPRTVGGKSSVDHEEAER